MLENGPYTCCIRNLLCIVIVSVGIYIYMRYVEAKPHTTLIQSWYQSQLTISPIVPAADVSHDLTNETS